MDDIKFHEYLKEDFPYRIQEPVDMKYLKWEEIQKILYEFFGRCSTSDDVDGAKHKFCIIFPAGRWDYFEEYFYFKNENDLIEFKMRFL